MKRYKKLTLSEHLEIAKCHRRMKSDHFKILRSVSEALPLSARLSKNLWKLDALLIRISSDLENLYYRDTSTLDREEVVPHFPHYGDYNEEEGF
jgi:hypothetical protein